MDELSHLLPLLRFQVSHPIYACCLLSLVILGYSANGKKSRRFRFHQELLKLLHCSCIATLTGWCKFSFGCGRHVAQTCARLSPSLTLRVNFGLTLGAFLSAIVFGFLLSIQLCPRQPILWLSQRRLLLDNPSVVSLAVGTCSWYRPPMRVNTRLFRSVSLFSAAVDVHSPPES